MSLFQLLDQDEALPKTGQTFKGDYSTAGDVFSATLDEARLNSNSNSAFAASGRAYQEIVKSPVFDFKVEKDFEYTDEEKDLRRKFRSLKPGGLIGGWNSDANVKSKEILGQLRKINPELYGSVDIEARGIKIGKESKRTLEKTNAGNNSWTAAGAGLAGGFASSVFDPVEVLTMAAPIGGAKSIMKAAMLGAAENVVIEGAKQGPVMQWQKKMGEEYGYTDALKNTFLAAAFGGVIGGGGKAISSKFKAPLFEEAKASSKKTEPGIIDTNFEANEGKPRSGIPLREKPSEILYEASQNPNLSKDVVDALRIMSDHTRDLENKPSFVNKADHVSNMVEVNKAYNEGRIPIIENTSVKNEIDFVVKESIKENLLRQGLKPSKADANADLILGSFQTMARESNKTVDELFREIDLDVSFNKGRVSSVEAFVNTKNLENKIVKLEAQNSKMQSYIDENDFVPNEAGTGFKIINKKTGKRINTLDGNKIERNSVDFYKDKIKNFRKDLIENTPLYKLDNTKKALREQSLEDIKLEAKRVETSTKNLTEVFGPDNPRTSRVDLLNQADIDLKNSKTTESLDVDIEELDNLLEIDPDMRVELDGKEVGIRELKEKIEADSGILKALQNCKVG